MGEFIFGLFMIQICCLSVFNNLPKSFILPFFGKPNKLGYRGMRFFDFLFLIEKKFVVLWL